MFHCRRHIPVIVLATCLMLVSLGFSESASSLTTEDILNIWRDQEGRMQDIYIDFDYEETREAKDGSKVSKPENIMYMAKGKLFRTRKRVLDSSARNGASNDWEFSVDGTRKYYCSRTASNAHGTVKNSSPEDGDIKQRWAVHYLSCLQRMPRKRGNLGFECNLIGTLEEDKAIELTEDVFEGRKVVVLIRPGFSKTYLDPELNFAVVGGEAIGKLTFKYKNSDFVEVEEGIWMPLRTERTFKDRKTSHYVIRKTKVNKLKVNNNFTKEVFKIKFGSATRVRDIDLGKAITPPGIDLDGFYLHQLLDIAEESDFINVRSLTNKALLVCFWDMDQRPSRNCIMQLGKKAQELKAKDVVVIAVQASKVEQEKLNEWIKENNVSFQAIIIQEDEEYTRFIWGMKSLPWLILTDKKHIVQAEGFNVNELDGKIKTITEK